MKLQTRLRTKPLFTTSSGIQVVQTEEKVVPHNILIHHPVNGHTTLNGLPLGFHLYQHLAKCLLLESPQYLVIDNVYNQVFIYPKTIREAISC